MKLIDLVRKANQLYSLPTICLQLQTAIQNQAAVLEIADLVALDPALSARLLRLANSSFYSFPSQIDTVSRAVKLIGTNELYNLALATAAVSTFSRLPRFLLDMDEFWKHSVYTGLIARSLGRLLGFRQGERLFAAGLMHNLGLLMVIEQMPEEVARVMTQSAGLVRPDLEQAELGFTCAEAGAALLEFWRLPPAMVSVVRHQHQPQQAGAESAAASLILIGNRAARHLQAAYAPEAESEYLASIPVELYASLPLDGDKLAESLRQAQQSANQVMDILQPGSAHTA